FRHAREEVNQLGPLGLRGDPLMLKKVGGDLIQSANRSGGQAGDSCAWGKPSGSNTKPIATCESREQAPWGLRVIGALPPRNTSRRGRAEDAPRNATRRPRETWAWVRPGGGPAGVTAGPRTRVALGCLCRTDTGSAARRVRGAGGRTRGPR